MDTYTFIAEYQGGTYVIQAKGASITEASIAWGKSVSENTEIPLKNKASFIKTLQNDLEETPAACLENTPNVWYFLADAGTGYVHVNAVKTDPLLNGWQAHMEEVFVSDTAKGVAVRV